MYSRTFVPGRQRRKGMAGEIEKEQITLENYWELITAHQGETFYTKTGLPFTYQVIGKELFADRRERSINRQTFEKAIMRILETPGDIRGPKALKLYGAPYIWAVLTQIGI